MTREEIIGQMNEAIRDEVATLDAIKYKGVSINLSSSENSASIFLCYYERFDKRITDKIFAKAPETISEAIKMIDAASCMQEKLDSINSEIEDLRKVRIQLLFD